MKTKKITTLGITIALAMVLSYVETLMPVLVPVPGVKAGFANIAVIYALYNFSFGETCAVSLVRIFIVAVLFGNGVSLAYSVAGAVLSLLTMYLMKKSGIFSVISVSVAGGVMHNIGQIIMASILMETNVLKYYLPFLLVAGIVAGIIIGVLGGIVIKRFKYTGE